MCDQDAFDDMLRSGGRAAELSRRQFGALTVGASLVSLLAGAACLPAPDLVRLSR